MGKQDSSAVTNARWRLNWLSLIIAVIALVGVCLMLDPSAAAWVTHYNQSKIVARNLDHYPSNQNDKAAIRYAERYNKLLDSGAQYSADKNLPTSANGLSLHPMYLRALNSDSTGLMGRIQIPSIKLDLPIYHGTSDATLLRGIGHLEGTSLPVGGVGTHAVLTGHRGLANATMFTHLDQVKVGDTFTITVFSKVLTYRVFKTKVVNPDETASLLPVAGKDLATLVTCTPLGINTQRIFVTGERVYPTPRSAIDAAKKAPTIPSFPWWALVLAGTLVVLSGYVWLAGRGRREPAQGAESSEPSDNSEM